MASDNLRPMPEGAAAPDAWQQLARALSPVEFRPRAVDGLEVAHQRSRAGAAYLVVRNPARNTYLRLEPREFDLLQRMDGSRSLTALVLEDFRLHRVLAPPRVAGLVELLRQHHFLTEPPLDACAELGQRLAPLTLGRLAGRLARAFLLSQFSLRRIDAWLERAYRAWGWAFFSRPAAVLALLVILLGLGAFINGLYTGSAGAGSAAGLSLWHVLGLTVLLLTVHELGHALAIKHARRHVPRAGLLIYYGFPDAFVDTTDIWMSPTRARLLVTLAGPLTGFFIGAALALAAFFVPEGALRAWLFAGSTLFWLHSVLNLNPLLELDGYFVLIDLLDQPRLRARALAFIAGPLWSRLWRRQRLSTEEWLYAGFGIAAAIWSLLAIALGLRLWTGQLRPVAEAAWAQGGLLTRAVLAVLGGLFILALALGLLGLAQAAWGALASWRSGLRGDAAARREAQSLARLQQVPLWASLPRQEMVRLARMMVPMRFPPGAEVALAGKPNHHYYLVVDGELDVVVSGQVVKRLGPGDEFGKRALLDDAPRHASVVATRASRLLGLTRDAFGGALADDIERLVQLEAALSYQAELGHLPLFHNLTLQELLPVQERLHPLSVAEGTVIIQPGDPDDRLYIVRRGEVRIMEDGRLLETLGPGEAFGGDSLLDVPASAMVLATRPTELLVLEYADLIEVVSRAAHMPAAHPNRTARPRRGPDSLLGEPA